MVTIQSVTCQPWIPLVQRFPHGVLDRLEERERHCSELDLQPEFQAAVDRGRLDAQADSGEERVAGLPDSLDGRAGAGRALDADGRGLAEGDIDVEFIG